MDTTFYAHSTDTRDKSDWQTLEDHLLNVAKRAEKFAAVFGADEWGYIAGLLHDAGKGTQAFQQRLEGSSQRVDHSTLGAQLAKKHGGRLGVLISYIIAGHHGGLPDGGQQEGELHNRLKKQRKTQEDIKAVNDIKSLQELLPPFPLTSKKNRGFKLAFFTRMLFSCLVDADFLDTEAFCSPERSGQRSAIQPDQLKTLRSRLNTFISHLSTTKASTPVNIQRRAILKQCREKAELSPRFFSLTVPTGGGKTISSLAFALDHALTNKQRRIIYALPFTSIIEQNGAVFREILGAETVLEHHCNYKDKDDSTYDRWRYLATENWDAPVVVTTNVQFFESLFSNMPSRCRKLHNIANSVIVLDEAQAIPTEYIDPCLLALQELVDNYSCSVVLCTATPPAFDDRHSLRAAIPSITQIIENPQKYYQALRRTKVTILGEISNAELTERINSEDRVLCIVSTKAQARSLYEQIGNDQDIYHLSTNMYPLHRRRVLEEIRKKLKNDPQASCKVISTSLVEAGVDLDFPVVYRAIAGLDSIAQAAGRCNREGLLNDLGKLGQVYVYTPETPARMPWLKRCASRAEEALRSLPNADPLGLEAIRRYFELLYDIEDLDKKQIVQSLNKPLTSDLYFPFREVAQHFHFIEDETVGIIIPYDDNVEKLVQCLRFQEYSNSIVRNLQQYSVNVRKKAFETLNQAGALEIIEGKFPVLRNLEAYSNDVGLYIEKGGSWSAESLVF